MVPSLIAIIQPLRQILTTALSCQFSQPQPISQPSQSSKNAVHRQDRPRPCCPRRLGRQRHGPGTSSDQPRQGRLQDSRPGQDPLGQRPGPVPQERLRRRPRPPQVLRPLQERRRHAHRLLSCGGLHDGGQQVKLGR
ncbi:uncharacterized protein PFL1_00753 [Pseudozyma flocculosa PF-1]|uniref:uncharacterized protein n=1 Tax=Pseudozyma flocculosa PF-1 TaxID=1277687 RepID=UPI0004561A6D|nr:uncharacterized protein PFL1_00753 [Pseudozyma flocculosa PF-1]EPQ31418.1 hypothetical protein PFL1_00753 [Pseudozyma flocculosa PF-1]